MPTPKPSTPAPTHWDPPSYWNIIAYYSFDDGTATTAYEPGGSLDGTISGATNTTGPDGSGALLFDGVDDRVDFPAALTADVLGGARRLSPKRVERPRDDAVFHAGNANRSVCLWADVATFDHGPFFWYGADQTGWDFSLRTTDTEGELMVQIWGLPEYFTNPSLQDGWHHYCLTYDGTDVVLYYDGAAQVTAAKALNTNSGGNFCLGVRYYSAPTHYFDGALDELYVMSSALEEKDVEALYLSALTPLPTSPPPRG